ncbi:hypothetical protein LR48_Vigan01g142800 [Vigna angularis]|uniref:Uncharacterized protein n=1 Tax=Phaseolus angularis TaxID=3914 RepID=A0A0L9TN26_PHAAN|nr:hypothetical protein LR48_Vigan01g142800 [Vigna angularis]
MRAHLHGPAEMERKEANGEEETVMAGAKRCKVQLRMGNLQASTFQQLDREEHSRLEEACTSRTSKEKQSNGEKKTHGLVQNCQANNESCTVKK